MVGGRNLVVVVGLLMGFEGSAGLYMHADRPSPEAVYLRQK